MSFDELFDLTAGVYFYFILCIICKRVIVLFLSGTPLRARTFIRNVRWGGHNSTVGVTLPKVWARSVHCAARGKPFKLFCPGAYLRQIPGLPQHPRGLCFRIPRGLSFCIPPGIGFTRPPGDWVSASPILVYARKILMQTGFFRS